MRRARKTVLWLIFGIATMLCAAALCACSSDDFSGDKYVPATNRNEVLFIEQNRLSFALGMNIDQVDVIARCIVGADDGYDGVVRDLEDGTITFDKFELDTVGSDKQIRIMSGGAVNYIYYDVNDYTVNFYLNEEQTELYKTVKASASLTDTLGLSVWVNMSQYNFSTDEAMRLRDADRTMRFDGWLDSSDNRATGAYVLAPPASGNERVADFHAHFITSEELADMDISYDAGGRRVFSGYKGANERVRIPEGVTYVDFTEIFKGGFSFNSLHIPSTVAMENIPLMHGIDSSGLKEITVDGGNALYASYNGALYSKDYSVLHYMPTDCTGTEFHPNLTEVGSYACAYWRVESLTLPNHLATLSHYCFAYSSLREVRGLDNVKTVKLGVFFGSRVNSFNDGGVAQYIVLDDGRYILSMILDESITSYKLLDGTISIAASAFGRCESLESIELCDGLEMIGSSAFSGCGALKSITLPPSLEKMGTNVFYECKSLRSVYGLTDVTLVDDDGLEYSHTLPTSTFEGCESLTDVVLPDGVEIIGPRSFYGCASLTSIAFPDSVEILGTSSFAASGFTEITLPKNLSRLGNSAFSHSKLSKLDLSVCTKILSLPTRCFEYTQLKEVHIPDRITRIPDYCFYKIDPLQKVYLNKVTDIGTYAFGQNASLTYIDFGAAETIGTRAFSTCRALQEVILPDTVKSVGGYAFASCSSLKYIRIGKNVKTFGIYSFLSDGVTFDDAQIATYLTNSLEEISVDEGNVYFKSIDGVLYGRYAGGKDFGECGVLYSVPAQYRGVSFVTESGERGASFMPTDTARVVLPYACHNLFLITKIDIGEGVENIGKGAFYNHSGASDKGANKLTELTLPSTVTTIGASILLGCTNVQTFSIDASNSTYDTDGYLVYRGDALTMYLGLSPNVVIRDDIAKIADAVFMRNTIIKEIVISDGVTEIGGNAFNGCTALTSITIGKGLKKLSSTALAGLSSLKTITVDPDNEYFTAENNVLYSKDGKSLILAAAGNGMTDLSAIRDGVTEICDYAFSYHKTLKSVVLPGGVKKVGDYSFYECRKVEKLVCCESLESIGARAFSFASAASGVVDTQTMYCDALKTVELYGNVKEIGDYAFYGQFGIEYTYYHMTYGQVAAVLAGAGRNITYLTHGCPVGSTGTYYNNYGYGVIVALYSAVEPTIDHDGYEWYHYNEDGDPELYKNIPARGPAE